jgi:sugar lactone lactonase YvrE
MFNDRSHALLASLALTGCYGASTQTTALPASGRLPQSVTATGFARVAKAACPLTPCLYVPTNANSRRGDIGRVLVFPSNANGDASPAAEIKGKKTLLSHPGGIALDGAGTLFIANFKSISVYAAGAKGDSAPIQRIAGPGTGLIDVEGLAIDSDGDIYVVDALDRHDSVSVFAAGSNGAVPPVRTIRGSKTGLVVPWGIALDANRNIYVANEYPGEGEGSITVYAAGASGNVAPIQTISGSNTGMANPNDVTVDAEGNIYATCVAGIVVFAVGASGNVVPMRTISGPSTGLSHPWGIRLDSVGDIYVTNGNKVLVFGADANGDVAPIQTIEGSNTGFNVMSGIAVH